MITARQREARKEGIGSSDAAAIVGLDQYRNAYDVWLRKTGRLESDDAGSKAEIGNALEKSVLGLVSRRINDTVRSPRSTFVRGRMRANIDGMIGEAQRGSPVVEVKTTGLVNAWGADGSGDIPDQVLVQVHHQMWCSESSKAIVACLRAFRGLELTLHPIEFDATLAAQVIEACEKFWDDHVVKDTPPTGVTGSLDSLSRVHRTRGKIGIVPLELVEREQQAKTVLARAENEHAAAKAAVLQALGDAENAQCGPFVVSYRSFESNRIDSDRLRREFPDVATLVTKTTTSRRFEVRKVAGGGVVE